MLAAVGVEGYAVFLSLTYAGAMLRERFSLDPARSGAIVSCYGAGALAFVLAASPILRRMPAPTRAAAGGCALGAGFLTLGSAAGPGVAAASLFTVGFGFLMLHNVLQVEAAEMAPDRPGGNCCASTPIPP